MKKNNYYSGQEVILITDTQGLKEGKVLIINSHYRDDEYECYYFENGEKRFNNFFENEFRLKTRYDDFEEKEKSSE